MHNGGMTDADPPEQPWSEVLRALAADPDGQLSQLGAARAARLVETLADPVRIGIVAMLAVAAPVGRDALAAELGLCAAEVAEHLQALEDANLIVLVSTDAEAVNRWGGYRLTELGKAAPRLLALVGLPLPGDDGPGGADARRDGAA